MTNRRYTRLTNGFSKKIENHAASVALGYFAYNFIKIHRTLRTSPAMASGVTDRLTIETGLSPHAGDDGVRSRLKGLLSFV
jgi:hypothetical protein